MRLNRQGVRSQPAAAELGYAKHPTRMPRDVAGAVLLNSARTKKRWIGLLSRNAVMWPLNNIESISRLQDTTLAEFQTLLRAASCRSWVHSHETHTRILHGEGICGFISVLSYFATGEIALFEDLLGFEALPAAAITEARNRWRFFGQREMDSQCIGCERICALVKYPESGSAAHADGLPRWDLLGAGGMGLRNRLPA